jgi:dienelactone hydrolase
LFRSSRDSISQFGYCEFMRRLAALLAALPFLTVMARAQTTPDPLAAARQALDFLLQQRFDDLRAMFDEDMSRQVSAEMLRTQVAPQLNALGGVSSIGEPLVQQNQSYKVFIFPVQFAAGKFNVIFSVDAEGRIAGMFLRPAEAASSAAAWSPPPYVKTSRFRDLQVTVGQTWKLPGTLTMPGGAGPFPGLVLVQGSGPRDRDETIGPNKPFRDIAEGLASRGIAVLRYDKRTLVYAQQMMSMPELTVEQEVIDDAKNAVTLMQREPGIDPQRVFLLGHSLGGYLAPRIAAQDPAIAGLIILAGNVRPVYDLLLEQEQKLGAAAQQLDAIKQQIAKIGALQPGQAGSEKILNVPASYWLDLKGYDPATLAARLSIPMLIMQGGRDYQVTSTDFNLWKAALAGKKNVTFRFFPDLNHLFISGQGTSTPAEYNIPGHVSEQVIDAISEWIKTHGIQSRRTSAPAARPHLQ